MKVKARYSVNAIGATSVTLTPTASLEDDDLAGDPAIFGTTSIVITQGVTPSAAFWKTARKYLVTVEVVDG